jgi:hypothetical protein
VHKNKKKHEFIEPKRGCKEDESEDSAGKMLHYLARARESNEQKGGKGGKKSGDGVKKQGKESGSLSDNESDMSVKPRKKSRGAAGGQNIGGTKSIGVSRGVAKVVKVTKPRTTVKGKKTLDYESGDFSSSTDDSTPKATMGKHSVKE